MEEAETKGSIDNEQNELIQNAIEFNNLTTAEVMTPKVDIKNKRSFFYPLLSFCTFFF